MQFNLFIIYDHSPAWLKVVILAFLFSSLSFILGIFGVINHLQPPQFYEPKKGRRWWHDVLDVCIFGTIIILGASFCLVPVAFLSQFSDKAPK